MFTGIIRETGEILEIKNAGEGKRLTIRCGEAMCRQLEAGITSVAINGACHTVETADASTFTVFSSFETLAKTTTGELKKGEKANLELPVTMSSFLDGHLALGHIDGVGKVKRIEKRGEAVHWTFTATEDVGEYLVEKDSIAIDGISLTIYDIEGSAFSVAVIPETMKKTSLEYRKAGDSVNLEVSIFAKYARKFFGGNAKAARNKKIEEWIKG